MNVLSETFWTLFEWISHHLFSTEIKENNIHHCQYQFTVDSIHRKCYTKTKKKEKKTFDLFGLMDSKFGLTFFLLLTLCIFVRKTLFRSRLHAMPIAHLKIFAESIRNHLVPYSYFLSLSLSLTLRTQPNRVQNCKTYKRKFSLTFPIVLRWPDGEFMVLWTSPFHFYIWGGGGRVGRRINLF